MKILFADSDEVFRKEWILLLEKKFGCKIVGVGSSNDAISYLKVNRDVSLIISDFVLSDTTADSVYRHVKESKTSTPFIWLTTKTLEGIKGSQGLENFEQDHPKNKHLDKHADIDELEKVMASILGVTLKEKKENSVEKKEKYCLVRTSRMADLIDIKHNYFIKEGDKYSQVVTKDSATYADVMNKLIYEKELTTFYLRDSDYRDLIGSYIPLLSEQLKKRDYSPEDQIYFQRLGIGIIYDIYYNLGIIPESLSLIPLLVSGIQSVASKSGNILGVIDLIAESSDFTVELALAQAYLSTIIALDMSGDMTSNVSKVVSASILQDLMLSHSHKLVMIDEIQSEDFKSLSDAEKNLVKKHPEITIPLLEKAGGIAGGQEVYNLIRHHHERPNGLGFPKELSSKNTPPLSCALILSKEIVLRILKFGDQITKKFIDEMMLDIKQKFYKDNYKEAFDIIPFKEG